jgi:hypothetical protein
MSCWFCKDIATMDKKVDSKGMKYTQCQVCQATDTGKLPDIPNNSVLWVRDRYTKRKISLIHPYAIPFVPRKTSGFGTPVCTPSSS